mgnify:CR=1 FL=1
MKHITFFTKLVSIVLLVCMLQPLSACKSRPSQTPQDGETQDDLYERPVYEDLSSVTVPAYQGPGAASCTVQANGSGQASIVELDFTKQTGTYMLSPTKVTVSSQSWAVSYSTLFVRKTSSPSTR